LISNRIIRTVVRVSLVFALAGILIAPNSAGAQGLPSWWGSGGWFDWSDYRAAGGAKLLLANLTSGTVTKDSNTQYELVGGLYGITNTFEPLVEFWGELYIDRLGIRGNMEWHSFTGRSDTPTDQRLTKLDIDFSRIGLDLDIVRYPFVKLGMNVDYSFNPVRFTDRSNTVNTADNPLYQSKEPWTLGAYGQAIPVRVRDVPVIAYGKFRFPMPFMSNNMPRITDWEIGAGIRPAIWDSSMFAHSAFSVAVEAGYRSINLETNATAVQQFDQNGNPLPIFFPNLELKARWQGAFFQVLAFF
jgi:hypothetical protein